MAATEHDYVEAFGGGSREAHVFIFRSRAI
jgi:hypothetical protein